MQWQFQWAAERDCQLLLLLQQMSRAGESGMARRLAAIEPIAHGSPRGRPRSATGPRQSGTWCLAWVAR